MVAAGQVRKLRRGTICRVFGTSLVSTIALRLAIFKRDMPEKNPETSRRRFIFGGEHIALIATVAAFLSIALKASVVSALNIETALTIIRSSGPVTVLLGAIVSDFTSFYLFLLALAYIWMVLRPHSSLPAMFGAFVTFLASVTVPWTHFVLLILLIGLAILISPWVGRRLPKNIPPKSLPSRRQRWTLEAFNIGIVAFVATPLILLFAVGPDFWLPAEVVRLMSGERIEGYVLEDDTEWTVLVRLRDRGISFVRSSDISSRAICKERDEKESPPLGEIVGLIDLPQTDAAYPGCLTSIE